TGKKITINGSDTADYDKAKVECFNCHKMGHFARECKVPRNQENKTRNQEATRTTVNIEDTSSKAMLEINGAGFDWSYMIDNEAPIKMAFMDLSDLEDIKIKNSEIVVLKSKLEKISNEKDAFETKIEIFENASQSLDKLIESQVTDNSKKGLGYVSYNAVLPPHTKRFSPPRIYLSYTGLPEFAEPSVQSYRVKPIEVVTQKSSVKILALIKENNGAPLIEDWESDEEDKVESPLEKKRKTIDPSEDKVEVEIPKKMTNLLGDQSNMLRCKEHKDLGVTRGIRIILNQRNQNNLKSYQLGNISYLTDFKEFDRGYVAFGGRAKDGKITSKGTIRTANESHVLLKVPRKNNMYSVDIKNIAPKKNLTCRVAKATNDESMLWHKRLGYINFKNINKLVKDNLVRGLPSKHFVNDQTCVACLKGKQHKVSFKSKIQNFISQPLFMLHMDLFGPTSVSSIMHKKYCFVITDDFSRFTWVFFLATKDETSKILKSFITEIEILVDKKVKIIRCDNGTKFKNRLMNEFCKEKRGRTPALRFMRPFGCYVTIPNTFDHLGKFDGKSDEGFFVGYSTNSKAFGVYNTRTRKVEENLHIKFLENKPLIAGDGPKWIFDIDTLIESMNYILVIARTNSNNFAGKGASFDADNDGPSIESEIDNQERPNHENSTKDINTVRQSINTASSNINTVSPTVNTVRLMNDFFGTDNNIRSLDGVELDISNISTTYLVPTTPNTRINKDHSLYNVISDIHSGMDVKSAFLYGRIKEEVYVCQPLGFEDPGYLDKDNGFRRGKIDQTLFIKRQKEDIPLVQVYVDDIIFGSTKKKLCTEFEVLMHDKFQMSSIGELTFFLGLHVKKKLDGIFIIQDIYVDEILRKFKYEDVKPASTSMDKEKALLKD
nr:hypothetical protein [Tanacetum cinerariifolium]